MLKFLLFLECLGTCFSLEAGWYVKGSGGMNLFHNSLFDSKVEHEPGFYISGSLGSSLFEYFRLEGEAAYRNNKMTIKNSIETIHAHGWAILGNAFLDIPCMQILFPYVGLGVGYQYIRYRHSHSAWLEDVPNIVSTKGLAAQGIVGMRIPILPHAEIDVDYRLLGISSHIVSHTLALSIGYNF